MMFEFPSARARKMLLALAVATAIGAFLASDLVKYFNIEYLKSQQIAVAAYAESNPWRSSVAFFVVFVAATTLSLPAAAIMMLAAGAILGLVWGTVIVSFASALGATFAFLLSRYLLQDWVQTTFGNRLRTVNEGVRRDGAFYLFTLRLVVAIPYVVINLVMALVPIRTSTFYIVSQIGMLPGIVVCVNAGTQLAKIETAIDVFSPVLIASFTLVGLFPLLAKKAIESLRLRRHTESHETE